jgi:hypothetical protein
VENDMEVDASFEHEVKSLIREFQS